MTDPAVCVPKASGTMPSATAAAEPLDEPPGVCAGLRGLAVLPGVKVANSVVTVFPSDDGAGRPGERDARGIRVGPVAAIDRRAIGGRHVDGVDQILDRDRDPVQRPSRRFRIAPSRGRQRLLAIEVLPGANHRLARLDAVEIGSDQCLGSNPALGNLPGSLASG